MNHPTLDACMWTMHRHGMISMIMNVGRGSIRGSSGIGSACRWTGCDRSRRHQYRIIRITRPRPWLSTCAPTRPSLRPSRRSLPGWSGEIAPSGMLMFSIRWSRALMPTYEGSMLTNCNWRRISKRPGTAIATKWAPCPRNVSVPAFKTEDQLS